MLWLRYEKCWGTHTHTHAHSRSDTLLTLKLHSNSSSELCTVWLGEHWTGCYLEKSICLSWTCLFDTFKSTKWWTRGLDPSLRDFQTVFIAAISYSVLPIETRAMKVKIELTSVRWAQDRTLHQQCAILHVATVCTVFIWSIMAGPVHSDIQSLYWGFPIKLLCLSLVIFLHDHPWYSIWVKWFIEFKWVPSRCTHDIFLSAAIHNFFRYLTRFFCFVFVCPPPKKK